LAWGLLGKAEKLIDQGETRVAAEILRRGVREQAKVSPRHLNLLGVCEARLGHREMARELFMEVLQSRPRDAAALTNMGNLCFLDRDHKAAGDYYTRALRENVFLKEPRFNLVSLYQDMGHFDRAMTAYEEYLAIAKANRWVAMACAIIVLLFLLLVARL